jgi:general secretion pathway protein K
MNKPGVILITTLLIVMVMSVISVQISKNFFIALKREAYLDFKNLSYQMLLSSEAQAIETVKRNIDSYRNKLTANNPLLTKRFTYDYDIFSLELKIIDGSNCFNLNSIFSISSKGYEVNEPRREWLDRYLQLKLLNPTDIESFFDQLVDWVDLDNQPLNFGAENYYYMGPMSKINQFTPKRLLVDLSEIKNLPIMRNIDFLDMSDQLCVIPGSTSQFININTLKPNDTMLIASFFDEENLEYVESQIMDLPEEGYDEVNSFIKKFTGAANFPSQILSINSKTFKLRSRIIDESFSAELETLVILDVSNTAKVLNRNFNF